MTSSSDNFKEFFYHLETALLDRTFSKLIISKPVPGVEWRKIVFSPFLDSRAVLKTAVEFFTKTQTERENIPYEETFQRIQEWLPDRFVAAHLKLKEREFMLEKTSRDSFRLKRLSTTPVTSQIPDHNRKKNYILPPDSEFLKELGIASAVGQIRREKYDKFRQIQKFIEIIADLVPESTAPEPEGLSVVDFGSGKNYLTFALHHFLSSRSSSVSVTGVEQRADLVTKGRTIAEKLGSSGLQFVEGTISSTPISSVDLVVALHACNTATDDALAKAIQAKARYICVAPCCHSYVRQQFTPSEDLKPMLRHGILQERFTEGLTDSLRVLTLEALGYQTKLFEFIPLEHTAKNIMITARFTGSRKRSSAHSIEELKRKFHLQDFYLDTLLGDLLRNGE